MRGWESLKISILRLNKKLAWKCARTTCTALQDVEKLKAGKCCVFPSSDLEHLGNPDKSSPFSSLSLHRSHFGGRWPLQRSSFCGSCSSSNHLAAWALRLQGWPVAVTHHCPPCWWTCYQHVIHRLFSGYPIVVVCRPAHFIDSCWRDIPSNILTERCLGVWFMAGASASHVKPPSL